MALYSTLRLLGVAAVIAVAGYGDTMSAPPTSSEILARYLQSPPEARQPADHAMEMDIQASLPRLQKQGTMHGLKVISGSGQVAYRFLRFTGDKLVKTDVIARFLTAEAQPPDHLGDIGITPRNYKIHFQKVADYNGTPAYIYDLKPRKKRAGLFKGELWLDAQSGRPVRETGYFVKSPSIFIRRVTFVRDYPEDEAQRTELTVQTRIVGDAEMVVVEHPVAEDWQPSEVVAGDTNGH